MEMLVVCIILVVLSVLAGNLYSRIKSMSIQAYCGNNLRQLHSVFSMYRARYESYPVLARPHGLGDRLNWEDLFGHLDAGMGYFDEGKGDQTRDPRVPRILAEYTDDIQVLFCPGQGANSSWKNLGPYYYNTNDPYATDTDVWKPMAQERGMRMRHPLAGCQTPIFRASDRSYTWRHGSPYGERGINFHLFVDASVRRYANPPTWDARDLKPIR